MNFEYLNVSVAQLIFSCYIFDLGGSCRLWSCFLNIQMQNLIYHDNLFIYAQNGLEDLYVACQSNWQAFYYSLVYTSNKREGEPGFAFPEGFPEGAARGKSRGEGKPRLS